MLKGIRIQIYTVYVYKHVGLSTHAEHKSATYMQSPWSQPTCFGLPVNVGEIITNMHNVVVPLIDNPTDCQIMDTPRDQLVHSEA